MVDNVKLIEQIVVVEIEQQNSPAAEKKEVADEIDVKYRR